MNSGNKIEPIFVISVFEMSINPFLNMKNTDLVQKLLKKRDTYLYGISKFKKRVFLIFSMKISLGKKFLYFFQITLEGLSNGV